MGHWIWNTVSKSQKVIILLHLIFFETEALGRKYKGLHEFEFNDKISVAIKHADINVSYMSADGVDNPGLLVTNKKRVVTFNEKANLRVGYQVDFQNNPNSKLFILAGIYTTFARNL